MSITDSSADTVDDPREFASRKVIGVLGVPIGDADTARNWIGNALEDAKRSQIMFIDRDDILNLYVVTNLPLPAGALPSVRAPWGTSGDEPPF